ncbi:MAG: hypothetical protein ACOC3Z_02385 [Nanoarchaeota archaeon]
MNSKKEGEIEKILDSINHPHIIFNKKLIPLKEIPLTTDLYHPGLSYEIGRHYAETIYKKLFKNK